MLTRLLALVLLGVATACSAQTAPAETFTAGTDYFLIEPSQPTSSGDKIEVLEVFGYSCGHCASFEPKIAAWKKTLADDVSFNYMPAMFGGIWETFARAYYTAETMGILGKTHEAMFKAVHVDKSITAVEDIPAFYAEHGVNAEEFSATMNSFAVNAKVGRSQQQVPRYGVSSTPTMIVAGKYRIEASGPNTHERMLQVADFLLAKERAAAK
ncbi:MAG: thiol:disulfide interchange protein DsbA/DsbL [Pseudomarimonas sp.]